ncbi:MAG TPA: hypothetical protein VF081_13435 [Solirubrobacterales bacterium]
MGTQQQEGGSATIIEAPWVTTLAAFIAVFSFLYGLAGTPEAPVEIVLAAAIFVASVSILVYRIETHLDSGGHRTLFRSRPGLALTVAAIALGAIAGILAELASSKDPPPTPPIVIYEGQMQEVLRPLREAEAGAFEEPGSRGDPEIYAANAREMGEVYAEASEILGGLGPPRPGDIPLHSRLVVRLGALGESYTMLGTAVGEGYPDIAAREAKVLDASDALREVEETLNRRGYRITVASERD